ncbi:MAG: patatin-like phospholipase family protein [Woeseiaceae bacterium]|nr:patatin-like phospholipase family protein [Woeseiaceae bacterium]
MSSRPPAPVLGLALGSGASRGWSHIGTIKALVDAGLEPGVVCGTSVGAMMAGAYLTGNLDRLEQWVLGISRAELYRFFGIRFSNAGFVNMDRMNAFIRDYVAAEGTNIEDLPKPYAAVATDLGTGREVWFREGLLADAINASMAMPGMFSPVKIDNRWLVDGGLVNPVPVSACRALGADVVIAVNLNTDIIGKRARKMEAKTAQEEEGLLQSLKQQAREYSGAIFPKTNEKDAPPGAFSTVSSAINIFQDRITRSRLAGDPADIILAPRLGDIGILEFGRAAEAMQQGAESVNNALPEIRRALNAS